MISWTSSDGACTISVQFDRYDSFNGAPGYVATFAADGRTFTDDTLRGPADSDCDEIAALRSLASFLSAWAEAQRCEGSENRDLFSVDMLPLADAYADEFQLDTMDRADV